MKLKADLFHCGRCSTAYSNPFGHTCTVKTDSAKRKSADAKTAPKRPVHLYQTCRDEACERTPCVAFSEGYDSGYAEGYADGTAASEGK